MTEIDSTPEFSDGKEPPAYDHNWLSMRDLLVGLFCLATIVALVAMTTKGSGAAEILSCQQKMLKLGQAVSHVDSATHRLPNSTLGVRFGADRENWNDETAEQYWKKYANTSSLPFLRRMMDEASFLQSVDESAFTTRNQNQLPPGAGPTELKGVLEAASRVLPEFICDADNINEEDIESTVIATQPLLHPTEVNSEIGLQYWKGEQRLGRTNFLPNTGVGHWGDHPLPGSPTEDGNRRIDLIMKFQGPFGIGRSQTIATIKNIGGADGLANTIMYGETVGEISTGKRTAAMSWFWGGHGRGSGNVPVGMNIDSKHEETRILGDGNEASLLGFGSKHPSGVNFLMFDNRVIHLGRDIDYEVFYALLGYKDKVTANYESIEF